MRDDDATPDDERHIECIVDLLVREPGLDALAEVVVDTVVAAEYRAGDETEQLFRPTIERAIAVGRRVEVEEALDAKVVFLVEDAGVHPGAVGVKGVEAVGSVGGGTHGDGVGCMLAERRIRPSACPVPVFVNASELAAKKANLRARFRAARLGLTETEAAAHSAAICERIASLPEIKAAQTVHVYWPLSAKREVDTRPLIRRLHGEGKRLALPVVADFDSAPRLRHVAFESEAAMQPNRWGILEPTGTVEVDPTELNAIIVPAFGAGRNGHRIGHGRGFYDAFLANLDAVIIGAVYSTCLVPSVPAETHDVPLDIIVTEREVWRVTE